MGARLFVGIDLGTTNTTCTVGAWDGKGRPEIRRLAIRQLTDDPAGAAPYGDRAMLPSAVCLTEDGKAYTGEHCKAAGADLAGGGKVVRSIKLQMGNRAWSVQAAGRVYHPRHVSALILKTVHASLRRAYPGAEVEKVTITIPASFSSRMRQETLRAAELAGFDPGALQLLDEPVAALFSTWDPVADAFPGLPARCNVLVFDMGGGTLDVSVLQVSSEEREVTVLATSRYNEVAGNDLDLEIAALLLQKARAHRDYNNFLEYDPGRPDDDGLRRQIGLGLMETAERVKLDLGQLLEDEEGPADLLHYIRHYADGGKAVRAELDLEFGARAAPRAVDLPVSELLECVEPLLTLGRRRRDDDRNIFVPVEQALRRANRKWHDLQHVYLVGGSSNFPPVVGALFNYFRKEPRRLDPFFAVSEGAVAWTYLRHRSDWKIREALHDSLFLKRKGHPFLEIVGGPIPVPAPTLARALANEECPYFGDGGRAVRLEFFQGAAADDPFMTLAHVERLQLPRDLAPESRLVEVAGALDENKVFRFRLAFQDARTGERVSGEVEFRPSSPAGVPGRREALPAGLSLNGEPV